MRPKLPCPRCGSRKIRCTKDPVSGWFVQCLACRHRGRRKNSDVHAIDAWNGEVR